MNLGGKSMKICKVCSSKYVDEINKRLAAREFTGETLEAIARDYRKISYSSLQRHNNNCLQGKAQEEAQEEDLDDVNEVELEDLKAKALEHYSIAIESGNVKLADSALGHLIRIEELISRRDDRALAAGKDDEVIEIELHWADDDKPIYHDPMTDYGIPKELPIGNDDVITPIQEPVCTIDDYKALSVASKPTSLIRNTDTGEIIGVDTPTGKIWKGPEPRELPLDEEDRDRGVLRRRLMSDGTLIEDIKAFKETYQEE